MWRVGSSRHDASSSGWLGLINARRGQHKGMMLVGGLGGGSRGARVSAGVSGTGHSRCAAARAWSRCCPACALQGWRHAGQVGFACRVTKCMRHPRWIGCWQPDQRCGRCCCWASGSMSPRQMGQGGMAGGVVAPGCVQSRSVGSSSSMGPPSSSVRSTTEVFLLVMLRGWEKSTRVGTRKSNDER